MSRVSLNCNTEHHTFFPASSPSKRAGEYCLDSDWISFLFRFSSFNTQLLFCCTVMIFTGLHWRHRFQNRLKRKEGKNFSKLLSLIFNEIAFECNSVRTIWLAQHNEWRRNASIYNIQYILWLRREDSYMTTESLSPPHHWQPKQEISHMKHHQPSNIKFGV